MNPLALVLLAIAPPLLLGIAQRVKSIMAGRRGPPLLQPYHDLARLLRKGAVTGTTATWISSIAPPAILAVTLLACARVPLAGQAGLPAFPGDLAWFIGLLGLARLLTVLLALDAGSSFQGMGASREVWLSALAEPALFLALAALAVMTGESSLGGLLTGLLEAHGATLTRLLVALALFIVLLVETARIPVDDPATHLELTMIHEVMLLDVSGPDLALCELAHAVKLYGLSLLLAQVALPAPADLFAQLAVQLAGVAGAAVAIGLIESVTARLALVRVPQLVIGAAVLAGVALGTALGGR